MHMQDGHKKGAWLQGACDRGSHNAMAVTSNRWPPAPTAPPGDEVRRKKWLKAAITPPVAAQDPPQSTTRLRPYIYVYDVSPRFSSDILQYRIERTHCTYRWGHHVGFACAWPFVHARAPMSVYVCACARVCVCMCVPIRECLHAC